MKTAKEQILMTEAKSNSFGAHLRAGVIPLNFADFLVVFFLLAIPIGYAFGAAPALLAVSLYCALLTATSLLLQRRLLTRACVGTIGGGLGSWVWFGEWLSAWGIYGLVGALVMAALSLGLEPGTKQLMVKE